MERKRKLINRVGKKQKVLYYFMRENLYGSIMGL